MVRFKRKKNGRFEAKSAEDRKVRSIRATDSAWESLGDLAEAQNMSRADLMEQLVEEGKLDFIQGLETLQAIANSIDAQPDIASPQTLVDALAPPPELEPLQELACRLQPLQELMDYLESLQALVQRLEPVQQLVQQLEPVKVLAQTLEPIQTLAQQLKPLSEVEQLQTLGEQVEIIQSVVKQMESGSSQDNEHDSVVVNGANTASQSSISSAQAEHDRLAIAMQVMNQFLETKCLDPNPLDEPADPGAEPAQAIPLSEFGHWLAQRLQSIET